MNNLVPANKIEAALIQGDLSRLSPEERLSYYKNVCESVGLNPLTKPFEFMKLNGREVLYANKGCAEQLRSIHSISLKIIDKQKIDDVYVVTAEAIGKDGRIDSATGAVSVAGLKGESLANAMMKTETKAKRRVTLSICGLNMLDEMEVETIPVEARSEQKKIEKKEGYIVQFGKWKGQSIDSIEPVELANYVAYIKTEAQKNNKEIRGSVLDFINAASDLLDSLSPAARELGFDDSEVSQ